MAMLYYHAERLHYAVIGTPNKHEVEQGFFVKYGDGGADIMPIAHLYKTQVYQLADVSGCPSGNYRQDTHYRYIFSGTNPGRVFLSAAISSDGPALVCFKNNYAPEEVGNVMDRTAEEVKNLFAGFERKIKTTEYLRMPPVSN